jgi:SAM-dependent methyltransferase
MLSIQRVKYLLRQSRLLRMAEYVRYWIKLARLNRPNKAFISANPQFKLPPQALAYEAYSAPDWHFYKKSGIETAAFLARIVKEHLPAVDGIKILEWGCGPARVIRHVPAAVGGNADIYGADYNPATISWGTSNIPNISFVANLLKPPLTFEPGFFDFIYAISVITHLSEVVTQQWIAELFRVARPGAVLVITTNGDSHRGGMLPKEKKAYQASGIVIRDRYEEGKRSFLAIHSPGYSRERLFHKFDILDHVAAAFPYTKQDYWVLRKPAIAE